VILPAVEPGFGLRDPNESCLIASLRKVTIHTVDARVEPTADEPFPERRVAGVQGSVPILVPGEQVRILLEALREVLLAEPFAEPIDKGVVYRGVCFRSWAVSPTTEEIADEMGLAPERACEALRISQEPPLCANSPVGEEQNAQLGDFVDRRPAVERPPPLLGRGWRAATRSPPVMRATRGSRLRRAQTFDARGTVEIGAGAATRLRPTVRHSTQRRRHGRFYIWA
jgi:hypothetical protein